jgi:riboflavin kinase, archaea type
MRRLKGTVASGTGDFSERMRSIPGLLEAYERKTGMRFFPGTLNLELPEEYSMPAGALRLDKTEHNGAVSVYIARCRIKGREAFVLRTESNESGQGQHSKRIIEIACSVRLRDALGLKDGDMVELELE